MTVADDVQILFNGLFEKAIALRTELGDRDPEGKTFSQAVTTFYAAVLAAVPKEEDRRQMCDVALDLARQNAAGASVGGAYADSTVIRADGTKEP